MNKCFSVKQLSILFTSQNLKISSMLLTSTLHSVFLFANYFTTWGFTSKLTSLPNFRNAFFLCQQWDGENELQFSFIFLHFCLTKTLVSHQLNWIFGIGKACFKRFYLLYHKWDAKHLLESRSSLQWSSFNAIME